MKHRVIIIIGIFVVFFSNIYTISEKITWRELIQPDSFMGWIAFTLNSFSAWLFIGWIIYINIKIKKVCLQKNQSVAKARLWLWITSILSYFVFNFVLLVIYTDTMLYDSIVAMCSCIVAWINLEIWLRKEDMFQSVDVSAQVENPTKEPYFKDNNFCVKCGTELKSSDQFCGKCGSKI